MRSIVSSTNGGQSTSRERRTISSSTSRLSDDERRSKESSTTCPVVLMHFDSHSTTTRNGVRRLHDASLRSLDQRACRVSDKPSLSHRPLHLKLDELVHLDGVLHGELLDQGLDEAADDQGRRFGFG